MMMDKLEWDGVQGLTNATEQDWYLNGTHVGTWTESRHLTYAKIFAASHMVGFDVPLVTNDMIMRFMDVDLTYLPGVAASAPGRVGEEDKVVISVASAAKGNVVTKSGSTFEDWYNGISAMMILFILCGSIALYFYFRQRGRLRRRLNLPKDDAAERVPLGADRMELDAVERAEEYELDDGGRKMQRNGKGKGKASDGYGNGNGYDVEDGGGQTVFALGDDEDR